MEERTLTALKGSIAKWEAIVAGTEGDRGEKNCPLCALFIDDDCAGCPVAARVNDTSCFNTPYRQWTKSDRVRRTGGFYADNDGAKAAAQAELDFLRSLLPADTTP